MWPAGAGRSRRRSDETAPPLPDSRHARLRAAPRAEPDGAGADVSDSVRVIPTDSGALEVHEPRSETLDQLRELFPKIGWVEDRGRRLLALLPIDESRALRGIRTGYGWYTPEQRDADKMLAIERLRIKISLAPVPNSCSYPGTGLPRPRPWPSGSRARRNNNSPSWDTPPCSPGTHTGRSLLVGTRSCGITRVEHAPSAFLMQDPRQRKGHPAE